MKAYIALVLISIAFMATLHAASVEFKEITAQGLTHSGGTDQCGCHYNRSTGKYHCHKRKKRGGDCPPASENSEIQLERAKPVTKNLA